MLRVRAVECQDAWALRNSCVYNAKKPVLAVDFGRLGGRVLDTVRTPASVTRASVCFRSPLIVLSAH